MKATDLRIGNYVLIPSHNNKSIPLIPCVEKKIKGINQFSELDFTEPTYPESHTVHINHCAGIPLTEEWLCNFGYSDNKIQLEELQIIEESDGYYLGDYENLGVGVDYIKYVHQLQNLYFSLTGEELEIKL